MLNTLAHRESGNISQHSIFDEIAKHLRRVPESNEEVDFETETELLAFELQATRNGETSIWGTYYRPLVFQNPDGSLRSKPDKSKITEQVLKYWEQRAAESSHPYLKFRYASLSWDLRGSIVASKKKIQMAKVLMDSAIEIAADNLYRFRHDIVDFVLHAMSVAISTKDAEALSRIRSALIEFETIMAEDEMLGTWGFCFDNLLKNKSTQTTEAQKLSIVFEIESRLDRMMMPEVAHSPFGIEACVTRLAHYYRRKTDKEKLSILLSRYAQKIVELSQETSGLFAVTWLQKAHSFLSDFGATGLANGLNTAIRDAGAKASEAMVTTTHKTTISDEEVQEFVAPIVDGTFESAFLWLTVSFVPNMEEVEASVKQNCADYPLAFLFGTTKMDREGRPIANVERPEIDMEGNVALRMADDLQFASFFLRRAIEKFREVHLEEVEVFEKMVIDSLSFTDDRKLIVVRALRHFFADDFLEFIHLAIPQIEAAVRHLVTRCGGTTLKRGRHGSLMQRNLDELIQENCIKQLYEPLGDRVVHYLKILLTDQRGWNLRNSVSHGPGVEGGIGIVAPDRLLHVLMLLALVREPDEDQDPAEPAKDEANIQIISK